MEIKEQRQKELQKLDRYLDRVLKKITVDQWDKINKLVKPQQQINFDQLEKEAKGFFKKEIKNQLKSWYNVLRRGIITKEGKKIKWTN